MEQAAVHGTGALVRARDELRRCHLRVTQQRVVVLAELMRVSQDSTAQALFDTLRQEHPTLGQATVYRTLGALVEAGVIDALQHGNGTCYRWCAPGHHHHLTCVRCHRVEEVHDCSVGAWATRVGSGHGFTQVRHAVELSGVCVECAGA